MSKTRYEISTFRKGQVRRTKQGSEFTIIDVKNRGNITIEFNDSFKFRQTVSLMDIARGTAKNPYFPSVEGVGYVGVGKYVISTSDKDGNRKDSEAYDVWRSMMRRCYNQACQEKHPSYKGCSVNLIWHCFQNFAYWYYNNPYRQKGWHLDKDLIVRGNKEYGPLRCAFLPPEVNYAMRTSSKDRRGEYPTGVYKHQSNGKFVARIGVKGNRQVELIQTFDLEEAVQAYKTAKEGYISEVGEKWQGLIDQRVVDSLKNWTVREDD